MAYLIYGVILRAKLIDALKDCNDHHPEICALVKQERRLHKQAQMASPLGALLFFPHHTTSDTSLPEVKRRRRTNNTPQTHLPEVKRVVPSLFCLCSSKIRNDDHDHDANKGLLLQRLPAEVKQRMAKERVVKKLIEFSSRHFQNDSTYETLEYVVHEILWSLLGLAMLEEEGEGEEGEGPFSFTRHDHSSSGEVTPGIVTVHTRYEDTNNNWIYFLTLGGRCTNEMPVALHDLEDCQHMVVEDRPSWWAHALKILQIEEINARPGFHLCVDIE